MHSICNMPAHGSRGIWPRDVLKKVSRGLSRVEAGHPGVPRLVQVTSGGFSWWLGEVRETGGGRGLSALHWVWCIGRGPHLQLRQEPQGTSDFRLRSQSLCRLGTGESGLVLACGMELRLPLEMSPGREAACRAVFGTWRFFPNDARKNCPFVLTSFTGWSSERCPVIGFLSRGDREIGVLRNVEPPTSPRLECLRETGLILRCDRKVGNPFQTKQGSRPSCPDQEGRKGSEEGVPENLSVPLEGDRDFGELCGSHQGCQVPFRPPVPNVGLLLRRCSGKGLHLAMAGEPRGFSRVTAGYSSYDGEFRLPLVLAQASPIFHSSCEGKLGIALE